MIDASKVDFNQIPKRFCDGAIGNYGKDVLYLAMVSGNSLEAYASTPQQMKLIANFMANLIENYEKQFGPIDMTPPSVVSPIQAGDIKK